MRSYSRPFYSSVLRKHNKKRTCLFFYQMSPTHSGGRLRGLAKHLTYDNFRTLLTAKNSSIVGKLGCFCHYDIIAELPLEINQKIFLYLPLHQCFKAQRVSRRWHKLLSAPQTIECLIRWWYPGGETDLCIPNDLSIEATLNLKAEHIDAFRSGYPFSKSILDGMPDRIERIVYANGVLAWINLDQFARVGHSIEILDLKTHLRRQLTSDWTSEDWFSFRTIAISSSIIAALDSTGRCHVWEISNPNKRYLLQLPSAGYKRLEASGPALAIASGQYDSTETEVFTWSSRSMITRSFLLPLHPVRTSLFHEWKIVLNPNGESLFLFETICSEHYGASGWRRDLYALYFTHTSFDGQICAQGQSEWLSSLYNVDANFDDITMMNGIADFNTPATLWLFNHLSPRPGHEHRPYGLEMIRICFNFERTSFEVEERVFASSEPYKDRYFRPLVWKDVMCWGDPADACTRILDFKESTCEQTKLVSNLPLYCRESDTGGASEADLESYEELCFGDETFLIHLGPSGCWKVWCFDKNIQMANEDLGYRSLRLKNPQKRILPGVS